MSYCLVIVLDIVVRKKCEMGFISTVGSHEQKGV